MHLIAEFRARIDLESTQAEKPNNEPGESEKRGRIEI